MSIGALAPIPWFRATDPTGATLSGAKLYTYASGTNTPLATYSDSALTVPNANPIVADSGGGLGPIYMSAVAYRLLLTTSTGVTVFGPQDNVFDLWQIFQATTETANTVYAGPSSGSPAAPAFRALVSADLPSVVSTGTWTPVLGGIGGTTGQTYTTQVGLYEKVGTLTIAQFNIILSAKGTITGAVQIQGLPFAIANVASAFPPLMITYFVNLTTAWATLGGSAHAVNGTAMDVYGILATAVVADTSKSYVALATGDLSDTTQLIGQIIYRATT